MKRYCGKRRRDGSVRVVVWDGPLFGNRFREPTGTLLEAPRPVPPLASDDSSRAAVSPAGGFDWGVESAASLALSRAILADCLGPVRAEELCSVFEWSVLRGLPEDGWDLHERDVRAFVRLAPTLRLALALDDPGRWTTTPLASVLGVPTGFDSPPVRDTAIDFRN
jgi:hypothetical protein